MPSTKTTGKDKKVRSRVLHVSRKCWLSDLDWIPVRWELWKTAASWDTDYFHPVPTRRLEHWERYECKYSEAAVLSGVLEAQLESNNTKFLCPKVQGHLWREHRLRAFLPSCTCCLKKKTKNWQDEVGGWSRGQSQGYVRTGRKRISVMQCHVAMLLRQDKRELLRETDLEKDISERLLQWVSLKRSSGPGASETSVESRRAQGSSERETKPKEETSGTWIRETKTGCWNRAKTRFRHGELGSMKRDSRVTKNLTCKTRNMRKRSLEGIPTRVMRKKRWIWWQVRRVSARKGRRSESRAGIFC